MRRFPAYFRPNIWPARELPELEPAFKELGQLIIKVGLLLMEQCDRCARADAAHPLPARVSDRPPAAGTLQASTPALPPGG